MKTHTQTYIELIERVLQAPEKKDRTGVGTRSAGPTSIEFDLTKGFPIMTCRPLKLATMAIELAWILRGETSTDFLHSHGVKIWDPWQDVMHKRNPARWAVGELGRVYGAQWRNFYSPFGYVDQLHDALEQIMFNPTSRRIFVSAWNPAELHEMALPPCHLSWQVIISPDGFLDMVVTQRSVDLCIGAPHDFGIYALLMKLIGLATFHIPRRLVFNFGDTHIYLNHVAPAQDMVSTFYEFGKHFKEVNPEVFVYDTFADKLCNDQEPTPAGIISWLEQLEPTWFDVKYDPIRYTPALQFPIAV